MLFDGASSLVVENRFENNGLNGITVKEENTMPTIRGNLCRGNGVGGILVCDRASPKVGFNIFVVNRWGIKNGEVPGRDDGKVANLGYNCVWGNSIADYVSCEPAKTDVLEDPKLVELEEGGYVLAKDSPCIGAGPAGENIGGLEVAAGE
jgi:hypothetical protein